MSDNTFYQCLVCKRLFDTYTEMVSHKMLHDFKPLRKHHIWGTD